MVRSAAAALKVAMADRTNVPGTCQKVTRGWFGAGSAGDRDRDGDADAVDGWLSEPVKARHPGDRNPPAGVPLAFSGGSRGFGHRCISRDDHGGVRSTDMSGGRYKKGTVGNATIAEIERSMGVKYLGWSETITGLPIPGLASKPDPKPGQKGPSTGRLPIDALDLSHWNTVTAAGVRAAMKAGVHDYWLKATEGIDFIDEKYAGYRKTINGEGGRTSGYHFGRPRQSGGKRQAEFFLSHAKIRPGKDNRIMLDLEDRGTLRSTAALTDWVAEFVEVIEAELGPEHLVYTPFDLGKTFGWGLWVARYHPRNALPRIVAPWPMWDFRQFSNGVVGDPHTVAGFTKVDLNNIVGPVKDWHLPKLAEPKPTPKPIPVPPVPKGALDFRVHLVPGNKVQATEGIEHDMALVKKVSGDSAVVFNTERESTRTRKAVSDGLGKGWTRVLENENTIAYGPNWHQAPEQPKPSALLLAKEDPSMEGVSPRRYLDRVPLEHDRLKGVPVKMKGLHLLSEANCVHVHVRGRKWREHTWPIQVDDVLDDLERDYKAGVAQVVAGDWNTGKFFTGKQLFALLKKRFGNDVVHVHRGALDHIFIISAPGVKLSEVGVEKVTNNASDHDMVTATIRVQKVPATQKAAA